MTAVAVGSLQSFARPEFRKRPFGAGRITSSSLASPASFRETFQTVRKITYRRRHQGQGHRENGEETPCQRHALERCATMAAETGISHTSDSTSGTSMGSSRISPAPSRSPTIQPAEKATALAVDEKSRIQLLDRTQPGLPMKKGRAGTMTHDG